MGLKIGIAPACLMVGCLALSTACSEAADVDTDQLDQRIWNGLNDPGGAAADGVVTWLSNGTTVVGCTGTMLTPQLMLTAGHCLGGTSATLDAWFTRSKAVDATNPRLNNRARFAGPGYLACENGACDSGLILDPPRWEKLGTDADLYDDVALVYLETPQETVARLNAPPFSLGILVEDVLDWGYPVELVDAGASLLATETIQASGYGIVNRANLASTTGATTRQLSASLVPGNVTRWSLNSTMPQLGLRLTLPNLPQFQGTDGGDSGGPWFVNRLGVRQQVGVQSLGCAPNRPFTIDPDGTPNNGDEVTVPWCTSQACPAGQIADAAGNCFNTPATWFAQCTSNQQDTDGTGGGCQYTEYWAGLIDVAHPTIRTWLESTGADPNRPGRLYGERDYSGACRPGADPDCDRNFNAPPSDPGGQCPAIVDAEDGFFPELRNTRVAVYGVEGVDIHDRAKVIDTFDQSQGGLVYGDIAALSGPIRVRNDSIVRDVYGGDSFFFGHRSSINSVTSNTCPGGCPVDDQGGLNPPMADGASVPAVRYTTTFPEVNGRREYRFGSMGAFPGDYTMNDVFATDGSFVCGGTNCNVQNQKDVVLQPGTYLRNINVHQNSRLILLPGDYYFDELHFFAGSYLVRNAAGGVARIHVREKFSWQGYHQFAVNVPAPIVVAQYGPSPVRLYESFIGTVIAPTATLDLYDPHDNYVGEFYARQVEVHQGVRVWQNPCATN